MPLAKASDIAGIASAGISGFPGGNDPAKRISKASDNVALQAADDGLIIIGVCLFILVALTWSLRKHSV